MLREILIVLFFAICMYTVVLGHDVYSVCKHKGPFNGWTHGDTMHVQNNKPIGTRGNCVYKEPTLWGSNAQIEDQSYEHTMHVKWSNPTGCCM